jgi:hypothetical protein
MKLQTKREALAKLNRAANESAGVLGLWDRRDDESGEFWDGDSGFWDSSGTIFARKAKCANGPSCRNPQ